MVRLEELKARLGDENKDMRLNLDAVLKGATLDAGASLTVALASALFLRANDVAEALIAEGAESLTLAAIEDARAAAAIMAMNTVYYRFRHMIGKDSYQHKPAGLRMNRMMRPATSKSLFELCSMACAALAGCEACLKAHDASLLKEAMTEDQIHESVRIAAVVNGFVVALQAAAVNNSPTS